MYIIFLKTLQFPGFGYHVTGQKQFDVIASGPNSKSENKEKKLIKEDNEKENAISSN